VCLSVKQQLCVADALSKALQIQASRHLSLLPLSTLLENVSGVYYPLLTGGTVITPTNADTGFSGSTGLDMLSMLQAIFRHQPTSIILLPQMLVGLVAALDEGWKPPAQLEFAAVGGAKVPAALIRQARDLGLPVYEGYGLSETASVACLNYPGKDLLGSTGSPLPHVQVSVEDGEVVVAGNTFLGYLDEPDTWGQSQVATGDLGEQDKEGFVHLYGRRKNVLISSFGRNISPEWVESELLLHPEISQCVVVGDSKPYCTALIAVSAAVDDRRVDAVLDAVNQTLPYYARIQRWYRLHQPLSHAGKFFTENGRPRRMAIAESFAAVIESMYAAPDGGCAADSSELFSADEPMRAASS
jgi:long-subunit acyl-CoA synthetase (AMP-forming)